VLDAWAVVALLKQELAGPRVLELVRSGDGVVSSITLGEALYVLARKSGDLETPTAAIADLRHFVTVDEPGWSSVIAAARLKATRPLSYADAFCVVAAQTRRAPLWTADPEILALADVVDVVDLRRSR
jgi:PIN domain nuclease of toxin-antitoxin system